MPRRRRAIKRVVLPEARYNSVQVARFINKTLRRGKKSTAQRVVYAALELVRQESKQDPLQVLAQALKNVTPLLEVKPRRVGGATYQVPVEVTPDRGQSLAERWLLGAARARKGMPMHRKLALELMGAAKGEGTAAKRREDLHKMAEANRAFVHYRW